MQCYIGKGKCGTTLRMRGAECDKRPWTICKRDNVNNAVFSHGLSLVTVL